MIYCGQKWHINSGVHSLYPHCVGLHFGLMENLNPTSQLTIKPKNYHLFLEFVTQSALALPRDRGHLCGDVIDPQEKHTYVLALFVLRFISNQHMLRPNTSFAPVRGAICPPLTAADVYPASALRKPSSAPLCSRDL